MSGWFFGLLLVFCVVATVWQPTRSDAAQSLDKIIQHIRSANILPKDYSEHINLSLADGMASVSVYRDPEAQRNDCKIDAILITRKVLDVDPTVKKVRVVFYNLTESDSYWVTQVASSAVIAYGRGAISQSEVIKAVTCEDGQSNDLAKTYSKLSYKQILDELGVVDGPERAQRAVIQVRISKMTGAGQDVSELRNQFLHVEDLARRGATKDVSVALLQLNKSMDEMKLQNNRISQLDALAPAGSPGAAAGVPAPVGPGDGVGPSAVDKGSESNEVKP